MKSLFATTVLGSPRPAPSAAGSKLLCLLLACAPVACTGEISTSTRLGAPGVAPTDKPPTSNPPGAGDPMGVIKPPPGPMAVDPGTKSVHRLNAAEYNATVADVLGTTLQPASSSWLGGELGGFDNISDVLDMNAEQYERYLNAATSIADDVFASADAKAKVMICTAADNACAQNIISKTGLRLFRRPLATDEVATYLKVYTAARGHMETHEGAVKQVLIALLGSSEFLYRIETDPDPKSTAKHPLTSYELASRLSYFLWSSAPDDALLAAAADNSILQSDKLTAAVDRMLMDPTKGTRFIENFAGQWLGARKLPDHAAAPAVYPEWSTAVATSLSKEMYMFFAEFVKGDRPWTDFLKADINFVDAGVAKLYGMPARATGTGIQRVEIKDDERYGFAGLGGFLAMSALPERTSPTLRGRWVLHNLLCLEAPPPPPGTPELGVAGGLDPEKNIRAALEEHRKSPSCAACHALFDPYGLSLEQFDGIGKFRTTYADGSTIDPTTELLASPAFPQGLKFTGLDGMTEAVTRDPRFSECVMDNLFTYSLGRLVTDADRPYLAAVQAEWKKGALTLRRLIQSLVLAETFRFRHAAK
jgi:hypothetical protein